MTTVIIHIEDRYLMEKVLYLLTWAPRLKKVNFHDCGLDEGLLATFKRFQKMLGHKNWPTVPIVTLGKGKSD